MKRSPYYGYVAFTVLMACGGPAENVATSPSPVASLPAVEAPKPTAVAPKPADVDPEEEKMKRAIRELESDRAKMRSDHESELARWTPALRGEAKALTEKAFASGKAALETVTASRIRRPGNAERDKYRHPIETLEFFGFKPTMTVLEYGPGEGWYTEILAPALAKKGKLFATNGDPNGPRDVRSTFYAERFKMLLDRTPELYGKVETVTIDSKAPKLGHAGAVDLVLVMRGLHGMVNAGKLEEWLATIHESLKPNGVLGIEEHRAPADANAIETSKKGYLPEKWVIENIERAGFKLAGKSELNANTKDTKDYPDGVWTLPPTLRLGDKEREKYLSIGESDRMTLKFTKSSKAAGNHPSPSPAGGPGTK